MIFRETPLPGAFVVEIERHADERGFFARTWCQQEFEDHALIPRMVQASVSFNKYKGILRGLHFQTAPSREAKLVRVTLGRVFDVVVDIRRGSPTFGQWAGAELSEDNHRQFYAPVGFAHAFLVLSDVAEFQYKCSDFYSAEAEHGLPWNDPDIAIEWPLAGLEPILSDRDRGWTALASVDASDLPKFPS